MAIMRVSNVEFDKWPEFRSAVRQLMQDGTYASLVQIHAERVTDPDGFVHSRHRMHGSQFGPTGFRRFLPWHRAYLIAFERELRRIDSALSIPYWDWDNDEGKLTGVDNFLGLSSGRNLGPLPGEAPDMERRSWFSDRATTRMFENFTGDYYTFSRALEGGVHNSGHGWVGGDMGNSMISPNDPIFWMHHAQIDRIWAVWQPINPNEQAFLEDEERFLDPWEGEFDVDSIDRIADLGTDSYEYQPPPNP